MKKLVQAGAVPYRRAERGWEFLLITSLRKKWIFPKGIVEPGMTLEEAALMECEEEAGIQGTVMGAALGSYTDHKWSRDCRVHMFLVRVDGLLPRWKEERVRQRRWCSYDEAAGLLSKAKLRRILEAALDRLPAIPATSD